MLGTYVVSFDVMTISASIPGQRTVALAISCTFLMPCRSAGILIYNSGIMQTVLPLTSRPSSIKTSSLIPQRCQEILGTWCE